VSSRIKTLQGDRILAVLGAVLVLVATALPWYTRDGSAAVVSLWDARELAAWLITGAVVFAAVVLVAYTLDSAAAGSIAAFTGSAVVVYAAIAMIDAPARTSVSVGGFLAIAGGIMLSLAGLVVGADEASDGLS
jgi:hypothetical protein